MERVARRVDRFQQRHWGLALMFGVVKKFGDDRAGSLAALIAYYGFLALFPLLLLLTTLLGLALGANSSFETAVLNSALSDFPIIGDQLGQQIRPLRGSGLGLAFGVGGLVWGSLGVAQATQLAMAEVWNVPGVIRPNFASRLARGLSLFGLVGVGLLGTTVLASFSTFGQASPTVRALAAIGTVTLNVVLYLAAFRLTTPASISTSELVPGAVLGGVAWSVLQAVGGYFVGHQLRYAGQVYGYFASVLGLVSWIYLGAQLTLYAAEFNVVRGRRLWPRSIVQPPLTEADVRTFDFIARQGERRPEQAVESRWDDDVPPPRPPAGKGDGNGDGDGGGDGGGEREGGPTEQPADGSGGDRSP